jgi:ferredoxin-type protein NapG
MPDDSNNLNDRRMNRRGFFRNGLRELLAPLAETLEQKINEVDKQIQKARRIALPVTPGFLRPPGALDEEEFLRACSRCGMCVQVCPAQAIKLDEKKEKAGGAPYIVADAMPCIVCNTLECMTVCPSGALVPTPIARIDMGTAEWSEASCQRSNGENCTICIDECPVGEVAIKLEAGRVHVIEDGCIGCGVCQYRCPTSPKSIIVKPTRYRKQDV